MHVYWVKEWATWIIIWEMYRNVLHKYNRATSSTTDYTLVNQDILQCQNFYTNSANNLHIANNANIANKYKY